MKMTRNSISGELTTPDVNQMANLYEAAVSLLEASGFRRYEVSNFAQGASAESSHNKSYWQGAQYIGIGPGAHSRVVPKSTTQNYASLYSSSPTQYLHDASDIMISRAKQMNNITSESSSQVYASNNSVFREARVNAADPVSWLTEIRHKGTGVRKVTPQTRFDVLCEYVSTGLRTSEGVTSTRWRTLLPELSPWDIFKESTAWLQETNMLEITQNKLKVTNQGLNVLDSILPFLLHILGEKFR